MNKAAKEYFGGAIVLGIIALILTIISVIMLINSSSNGMNPSSGGMLTMTIFVWFGAFTSLGFGIHHLKVKYLYIQTAEVVGIDVESGIRASYIAYVVEVKVGDTTRKVTTNHDICIGTFSNIDSTQYVGKHVKVGLDPEEDKWIVL